MSASPQLTHSTDAFAVLDRITHSETTLDDVLVQIIRVAEQVVPGAVAACVLLAGPAGARTTTVVGGLAAILDEWQFETGQGPSLAAAAGTTTVVGADLAAESRWPDWTGRALDSGVHSCLAVGLPVRDGVGGAVTVYAAPPHAFDEGAVVLVQAFAGYAAVAMANAHRDGAPMSLTAHLRATADARAVIEQAKGVVMAERGCSAPEAFAVLAEIARHSQRRVGEVAAGIIASTTRAHRPTSLMPRR